MNGKAAQVACQKIKERLIKFAMSHYEVDRNQITFKPNKVEIGSTTLTFAELVQAAYLDRVSLSATGFYKTPKIHYDAENYSGRPFYYFAYGAAVSEAVVDTLTGENKITRVDILHDTGKSLNPAIDLGQVEGGFIQGMGWLTTEELVFDDRGNLGTHAPSTYKIPTCSDRPGIFNMSLYEAGENVEDSIHKSKAVGEPPFMLSISAFNAIADAISSTADYQMYPALNAPATPENILKAISGLTENG